MSVKRHSHKNSGNEASRKRKHPSTHKHHHRSRKERKQEIQDIAERTALKSSERKETHKPDNSYKALYNKQPTSDVQVDQDGDEVIDVGDADEDSSSSDSDTQNKHKNDIILLDSDTESKGKKKEDELEENHDFIAFDFDMNDIASSSDEDDGLVPAEQVKVSSVNNKPVDAVNPKYPWLKSNDHTKQLEVSDWLTMEIKDFAKYISPSEEEIKARNSVVHRLNDSITKLWPDAELHCFGSYATDLYLPGSDIDTVIISKSHKYDTRSSMFQLASYIRTNKLGKRIETLSKTKVPIIKLVDPPTGYHIDISFERANGISAAQIIIDWIKNTPGLRELVMIIKQFLSVRKLNEVHTGGLGGFSIICLVYSFLKLHPRVMCESINPLDNLGVLLIEFFELYGFNFGYDKVAIAFKDKNQPIYVKKASNINLLNRSVFSLAIQDPQDPNNNISRGTFNIRDIKRSFGGAYEMLTNKCYEMNVATYKQRLGQSILGDIIEFRGKARDFVDARGQVKNHAFLIASGEVSHDELLPSGASAAEESSEPATSNGYEYVTDSSEYEDSDSDSTDSKDNHTLNKLYEKSQEPHNSRAKASGLTADQIMGINDDNDSDDEQSDRVESSADSQYEPLAESTEKITSANRKKVRSYWLQKAGTS